MSFFDIIIVKECAWHEHEDIMLSFIAFFMWDYITPSDLHFLTCFMYWIKVMTIVIIIIIIIAVIMIIIIKQGQNIVGF